MAYVKPQFLCQDMPLTFEMVNVIQDDLYDEWLQFAKWHGTRETLTNSLGIGGVATPPGLLYGSHNDKRIPRATVLVQASALSPVGAAPSFFVGEPSILKRVVRVDVGVVEADVALTEYFAECTPFGSTLAGALRIVTPTSIYGNQGAAPKLRFECRELVTGVFTLTDFDFVAHIYGTP
jgi:hypothetical protein